MKVRFFFCYKAAFLDWLPDLPPRYVSKDIDNMLRQKVKQKPNTCFWCGGPLSGKKRKWCKKSCIDEYLCVRGDSSRINSLVLQRDKGVCSCCGIDTLNLNKRLKELSRKEPDPDNVEAYFREIKKISLYIGIKTSTIQDIVKGTRRKRFYDIDHIKDVQKGGGCCFIDNLQTLCLVCHMKKHSMRNRASL